MLRSRLLLVSALIFVPAAAWPQGEPLGPEFRANTYTTNNQLGSAVSRDTAGNFVVVWTSWTQDGSLLGIFAQRYAASGSPLGSEFQVNTYTFTDQRYAAVASDPSGNFVVVWNSVGQDGSGLGLFGQRYAASGLPLGQEFRVNTYTAGNQTGRAVAADSAGNFTVVWEADAQDGSSTGVVGQRFAVSGAPVGPEFRVNSYTTGAQAAAAASVDGSGNFVVVWQSDYQDGSGEGVFAQRFAVSGAAVGPEFQVNTYTTNDQMLPAVSVDPAGNFVVAWCSRGQDGGPGGGGGPPPTGVYGQRYSSSGSPLGTEFLVNTYTTSSQCPPSVASDASGNFVVVWHSPQDGSSSGVFGQRYASSGAPLGGEFRVNTYTTDLQLFPRVAADSAGNFVVVWDSETQDGSVRGVFGQRYGQIVPVKLMEFGIE